MRMSPFVRALAIVGGLAALFVFAPECDDGEASAPPPPALPEAPTHAAPEPRRAAAPTEREQLVKAGAELTKTSAADFEKSLATLEAAAARCGATMKTLASTLVFMHGLGYTLPASTGAVEQLLIRCSNPTDAVRRELASLDLLAHDPIENVRDERLGYTLQRVMDRARMGAARRSLLGLDAK
jgi:hypothetical protein